MAAGNGTTQQHCGIVQVGMAAQQAGGARQQQEGNDGMQQSGDNVIPPAQQQGNGISVSFICSLCVVLVSFDPMFW